MSATSGRDEALKQRLAGLSPEKRAALRRLLGEAQDGDGTVRPRDLRLDPPPVSFQQRQLWILDRLAPGNAFYNESTVLRLAFAVDPAALETAVHDLALRHESLRTTFASQADQPVQVISPRSRVPFAVVDLQHLPQDARDGAARQYAAQEAGAPFDLGSGPLMRVTLLRLAPADHLLLLTLHHIIFDGWSFSILLNELSELYDAWVSRRPHRLLPVAVQYPDYAVWQRRQLRGGVLDAQRAYWRSQLADLSVLQLPTDRPRPKEPRFEGARVPLALPASLYAGLKALSRREGLTVFMVLLTAFKVLLQRYTGQDDIVVGVPTANRQRAELEGVIGLFVNVLVMRTDLSGDPSFRQALARVRQVTLDAFAHQDLPYEQLVEDLQPQRDPGRNPLFQVSFQVNAAAPGGGGTVTGIADAPSGFEVAPGSAKFDLRVDLVEHSGHVEGFLEYDTALFDRETVVALAQHYGTLVHSAVTAPDRPLSQLECLTPQERQILLSWSGGEQPYPRDADIPGVFEAQVRRTPGATAVEFGGVRVSYAELNRRANQLARRLQKLGVGPQVVVGIGSERSAELIVGLLGILKAGGAYLPLDLDGPPERLAFQLRDAEVRVIVTRDRQLYRLAQQGTEVLALTDERDTLEAECGDDLERLSAPTAPAYVMYTSGSTGTAKAVCVPHRGVVRLVCGADYLNVDARDTFLHLAPLSFDASTLEVWGALLNGARLMVYAPHVPTLEDLGQAVQAGVTVLWLTSALFVRMVDVGVERLAGLKLLLAGGDVLPAAQVRRALAALPGCTVINGYGPTENTTFTCVYPMTRSSEVLTTVPIGRPVPNTRVYVLGPQGQLAPIGVPGELYAGGDGVALGYLNRPDLTREKFVPDPFSASGDGRLYRTGDIVRWRRDGQLEFLGRADAQVKIRGYRVELPEVEGALLAHPAVREAACTTWEDVSGDRRLAAYLTTGGRVDPDEVRRFMRARLPEYLVPVWIEVLDALPLTASGKLDRRALPVPQHGSARADAAHAAPATHTERVVAALWQEVLGVPAVGTDDNFFDLGGHSLLLVLLHNRLREHGYGEVSVVDLFRYPTVGTLASVLDTHVRQGSGS